MRIICTIVGKDIEERALLEKGRGQNHILELRSWELSGLAQKYPTLEGKSEVI